MKTLALLIPASLLLVSGAFAQSPTPTQAPPPPGLNDPGAKAVEPAHAGTATALDLKPQALPSMRDEGHRELSIPDVTVHRRGEDVVQEFSRNGQVYMIVVTPKSGIAQTYMVDPQGRVFDEHGKKPVRPVMYKVMEWGKSRPAEADTSDAPATDGN